MSLYGETLKIGGVVCGLVLRGRSNGEYRAEIEAINWSRPALEGESILPAGYGFTVTDIQYSSANRSYTVVLRVEKQYLGDVTEYQEQVSQLQATVQSQEGTIQSQENTIAQQQAAIQALEAAGTAAELERALEAAYQEGVESNG